MKTYERVYAGINLDAILYNLEMLHRDAGNDCKVMMVIKTDAYGHGAVPIARETQDIPYIFGYATATAEEALILRKAGIVKPILILGYVFDYSYEELIRNHVSITVFTKEMADEISVAAQNIGMKASAHIKVDTGMGRIGLFPNEEGLEIASYILNAKGIEVDGIFTHFAKADERDLTSALHQYDTFTSFVDNVELTNEVKIPIHHCSNSAAIMAMPESNMDMVRAGITMYGILPSNEMSVVTFNPKPVLSLLSKVVYVKKVPVNTPISYGHTYITKKEEIIATVPVGYGDGYPRDLSNVGYVLIHGKKAPIIGRICMDQFMIDVTDIPNVSAGDAVTLIGTDGNESITIEQLCELYHGFPYEFICDLSKRIPRLYYRNGQEVYTKDYYDDIR